MQTEQRRQPLKFLTVVMLMLAVTGCATRYGAATFNSEPDGVQVLDMEDGSVIGVTPVRYLWRSKETDRKFMNVRLYKDGYKDVVKSFWLSLDHGSEEEANNNPQSVNIKLIED